jgi:hypothetical protein
MTRRATFTQTELARAIAAAEKAGRNVAIIGGAILIVAKEDMPVLPLPGQDEEPNTCDSAFGVSG